MRNTLPFLGVAFLALAGYVGWRAFVGDVYTYTAVQLDSSAPNVSAESLPAPLHIEDTSTTTDVGAVPETPPSKKLLFVGDIFLDRYIRQMAEKHGDEHTFGCVTDLLSRADVVVGNLEGPITDNPSKNVGTKGDVPEHYTFTFATTTAPLLAKANIRLVNLGNNHIGNFGREGITATREYLTAAGVSYFGGIAGDEPVYRDGPLSFVSYNQFGGVSQETVADTVAQERASGQFVIVYTHWGEEYITTPGYLRAVAEQFVAAGAGAIFGSHPHVVIPMEYIDGVPVYYSLGNFIFDQYWNDDVSRGLAVLAAVSEGRITTEPYPIELMPDGRVCDVADDASVGR